MNKLIDDVLKTTPQYCHLRGWLIAYFLVSWFYICRIFSALKRSPVVICQECGCSSRETRVEEFTTLLNWETKEWKLCYPCFDIRAKLLGSDPHRAGKPIQTVSPDFSGSFEI